MSYQIHITRLAEQDLNEAADHIEFVLKNPTAAEHLLDLVEERISSLADNPEMHPLIEDPVLNSWGVRFVIVNNYLAFYTVDTEIKTIYIVRFLYGKRDWMTVLHSEMNEISEGSSDNSDPSEQKQ